MMPESLGAPIETADHRHPAAPVVGARLAPFGLAPAEILALLDQSPTCLCLLDGPEHVVAYASGGFGRLVGVSDPVGRRFSEIVPQLSAELSRALHRARADNEAFHLRSVPVPTGTGPGEGAGRRYVDLSGRSVSLPGREGGILLHAVDVTGHVETQDALRESHERAESILSVLGDGFVAFDEEFRVTRINEAALRFDGREEKDILGKTHWEAWPTSAGSVLEDIYRRCLAEQVPLSFERLYQGFGRSDWLELRVCPVRGGIVSFYRDVTERKRAEEALRASEERFRALVEAVPHQVWEAGPDGRIEWINRRYRDYTGATLTELQEGAFARIIHPQDYGAVSEAWRSSLRTGGIFERDLRIRRAGDGTYRWFLSVAVPVRDGEGTVVRWIGTNTEIDEQKQTASTLAHVNAQLEERITERTRERDRMWRLSTDLMLVSDLRGRIIATNPAWHATLSWRENELAGMPLLGFVHADDRTAIGSVLDRLSREQVTSRFQSRLRCADGSYRWIAWTAVPDEHFIHAVGRDVTVEREATQALRQAEEALRQSQKMEAVGQLTGGIAHDFNNLLTGITGSLDLIQARVAQGRTDQLTRYVEAAKSSANRAAALTHRLLAFSRRQPLDPKPVDAGQLVASMEELLRRTTTESVRVELQPGPGLWLTHCDANQLENALLNLVINARDATPHGGSISIRTANVELAAGDGPFHEDVAPGQYVALSVTDTGSGMAKDVLERVFEPFFTTKPIGQGTGLGLSMVYGFVRQSGGHVQIRSEPGAGTAVTIYLPRYLGAAEADTSRHPPRLDGRARSDETVLVVEDDPVVREVVTDMLRELGYRVLQAGDGPEGLRILQGPEPVSLLLTDVGLPGLNGRQLADAARERRRSLKVLFMTGYVEHTLLSRGFLGPDMEVITKPFTFEALAAKIEEIL
jgi:PAS domain S-box-containing protein